MHPLVQSSDEKLACRQSDRSRSMVASTQTVSISVYISLYEGSSTAKLHAEVHSEDLIYAIYSDFNNGSCGAEWAKGVSSEAKVAPQDRQAVAVLDLI